MYIRQDLFPVPLFRLKYLYSQELLDAALPYLYEIESNDEMPVKYSNNGYTNYGKTNILDLDIFKDLKKFLYAAIKNINLELQILGDPVLTNSWFSINRLHSYHERHNHLPEVWSGVYYLKANVNDSPLTFYNKNLESNWPYSNLLSNNSYNSSISSCTAETGVAYIFPSYIDHAVGQQTQDSDRITIAFNFNLRKEL